jgi:hypothetical protein
MSREQALSHRSTRRQCPASKQGAQLRSILARITFDRADLRKLFSIGLTDIEHVGREEPSNSARGFFALFLLVRFAPNDWSENHDALLALPDKTPEFIPRAETSDVTGIRFLRSDEQRVVKAIAVETPDGLEISGECLAVTSIERSDELLGGLDCDFL